MAGSGSPLAEPRSATSVAFKDGDSSLGPVNRRARCSWRRRLASRFPSRWANEAVDEFVFSFPPEGANAVAVG
jgi:hypothetical protein